LNGVLLITLSIDSSVQTVCFGLLHIAYRQSFAGRFIKVKVNEVYSC